VLTGDWVGKYAISRRRSSRGPCGEHPAPPSPRATFPPIANYRWYELRRNGDRVNTRHARPRPSNFRRRQQDRAERIGGKPLGSAIRGDTVRLYCSPTPEFTSMRHHPQSRREIILPGAYLSEQSGASGNLDFDFAHAIWRAEQFAVEALTMPVWREL